MNTKEIVINPKITTTAFGLYRQRAFSKQEIVGLPKKILFPFSSEQDLEKIYSIAERIWMENFNNNEFKNNLNLYMESNDYQLKTYFKEMRKDVLILKSAYRFADAQRVLPEEYDDFVRNLGRFNDGRYITPIQVVDEIYSKAVRLVTKPERHATTSLTEANERVKWICNKVKMLLSTENNLMGEKENFHNIRRLTRHLMNLYQLMGVTTQTEEYTDNFLFLHKIVDGMGTQLDINKEVFSLEEEPKQNLFSFMGQLSDLVGR